MPEKGVPVKEGGSDLDDVHTIPNVQAPVTDDVTPGVPAPDQPASSG